MTLEKVNQLIKDCGNTFACCGKGEEWVYEFFPNEKLEAEWTSGKTLKELFDEHYGLEEYSDYGYYINPKYDTNLPPLSEVEEWYGYVEDQSLDLDVLKYGDDIVAAKFSID